ncbi:hypothetical protein M8J76_003118 [Diaphorina citri]|nr:hypothetical protein M8J76_003118 [Diaphorina citri]
MKIHFAYRFSPTSKADGKIRLTTRRRRRRKKKKNKKEEEKKKEKDDEKKEVEEKKSIRISEHRTLYPGYLRI